MYQNQLLSLFCVTVFKLFAERTCAQRTNEQQILQISIANMNFCCQNFWEIVRSTECVTMFHQDDSTLASNSIYSTYLELFYVENLISCSLFGEYYPEKKRDNCNNTICSETIELSALTLANIQNTEVLYSHFVETIYRDRFSLNINIKRKKKKRRSCAKCTKSVRIKDYLYSVLHLGDHNQNGR